MRNGKLLTFILVLSALGCDFLFECEEPDRIDNICTYSRYDLNASRTARVLTKYRLTSCTEIREPAESAAEDPCDHNVAYYKCFDKQDHYVGGRFSYSETVDCRD